MKFNFSNMQRKKIHLKISKNEDTISYITQERESFWNVLRGPTSFKIDSISGILYGGSSITFRLHKKSLLQKLKKK